MTPGGVAIPKPEKKKKKRKKAVKKVTSRQRLIKSIDSLCSDICLLESDFTCLMCGKPASQTHHFFPKGSHGNVRFDMRNHCALDYGCHIMRVHSAGEVEELRDKLIAKIGKEEFDEMKTEAYKVGDFSEVDLRNIYSEKCKYLVEMVEMSQDMIGRMSDAMYERYVKAKKSVSGS